MINSNKYIMGFKKGQKKTELQIKSSSISAGVHSSNRAQLKKIKNLEILDDRPQVPTSNLYMYVNKNWVHKGTSCRLCGVLMSDNEVLLKHQYICKVLNKKSED